MVFGFGLVTERVNLAKKNNNNNNNMVKKSHLEGISPFDYIIHNFIFTVGQTLKKKRYKIHANLFANFQIFANTNRFFKIRRLFQTGCEVKSK